MDIGTKMILVVLVFVAITVAYRHICWHTWAKEEYIEFCYHMNMWLNDAEQGMGWADTIYQHQFGLCWNFNAWLVNKGYTPRERIYCEDWVIKHIYKGNPYPFGDRDWSEKYANKYTSNPLRRNHVRHYARKFAP